MSSVSWPVLSVPGDDGAYLLNAMMNKVGAPLQEARVRWRWRIACPRQDWAWRLIAHDLGLDLVGEMKNARRSRGIVGRLAGALSARWKEIAGSVLPAYWNFAISADRK